MVAERRINRRIADENVPQVQRNSSHEWDDRTVCSFAEALRPSSNYLFNNGMNQYIIGPLTIASLSRIIHHNNIHHHENTVDQCGRLVVIIEARRAYEEYFDVSRILGRVLRAIGELEERELRRPSLPCSRGCSGF